MAETATTEQPDEAVDTTTDDAEIEDPRAVLELNDKYRRENKGLRDRLKAAEAELEELRKASMTEQEKAIEEAKDEARKAVESEYHERLLAAAVRARAAGVLTDPEDAWRMIDFPDDTDPDDEKAIDSLIGKLVEAKPYLAVQQQRQRPGIDQGPQGNPPGGSQTGNDWLRGAFGRRG